jgi:hypothetical protein
VRNSHHRRFDSLTTKHSVPGSSHCV